MDTGRQVTGRLFIVISYSSFCTSWLQTMHVKRGRRPLTSLHQHGDLAAFGTLAQQVDHLVVRHALHISLVHLHDNVALLQATASWIVHYLLDSLASASGAVCDGKTETLLSFLHVNSDQLRLCRYGWCQGDHVAGVAVLWRGVWGHLHRGATGPREAIEGCASVARSIVVLTAVAGRRVVAVGGLLAIDDDGVFVLKNGNRGDQAGVGIIGVKGERVATAQLQVDHGADWNRLEDLHNLGMSVTKYTCVIDTHNHITLEEERSASCYFAASGRPSSKQNASVNIHKQHFLITNLSPFCHLKQQVHQGPGSWSAGTRLARLHPRPWNQTHADSFSAWCW